VSNPRGKGPKGPDHEFKDPPDLAGLLPPYPPMPLWDPQFDAAGFNELIQNRGLRFLQFKAVPCPNVKDLQTQLHNPNCTTDGCENGFLMFPANEGRPIYGMFYQAKLERFFEINGLWDTGSAIVTFTSYARGPAPDFKPGAGEMIDFSINDKIVCLDFLFSWSERLEHSPTGLDRLKYPAKTVEFLADKDRRYQFGVDFSITEEGRILWLTGNRPKRDPNLDIGAIITIRYQANPVFYIDQMLHELRATKGINRETGALQAIRLPQQVLMKRDYLYADKNDHEGEQSSRAPRSGTLVTPQ
jgi:hypothetical protein